MQIKELKKQIKLKSGIQVCVISHASSGFYLVQIRDGEEVELLTNWRGQQRVFRSLDEATSELKHQGITRAVLLSHVANDEMIGREPFYNGLNPAALNLCF